MDAGETSKRKAMLPCILYVYHAPNSRVCLKRDS